MGRKQKAVELIQNGEVNCTKVWIQVVLHNDTYPDVAVGYESFREWMIQLRLLKQVGAGEYVRGEWIDTYGSVGECQHRIGKVLKKFPSPYAASLAELDMEKQTRWLLRADCMRREP
jgi:hypothetical protein